MNPSLPPELFGYRVVAKLGSGAASELYAVQDAKTKQVWALKHVVLKIEKDARFIEQVEQEYNIGSKLDHPNVRSVGKILYKKQYLMKKVEVGLLLELIDADPMDVRKPQTLTQAVDQFRQIARGLQHMHEKGFVHADMKPINAMVDEHGHVKIIDLGQACAINTKKSRIQGTPGYIAPEQARRDEIVPATDVYNLGATMHWVLMGSVIPTAVPPAGDGTVTTVDIERIKPPEHPSKRNPAIPQALGDLILDCVKVRIEDRPTMDQVIQRLEALGTVGASGWKLPDEGPREGT